MNDQSHKALEIIKDITSENPIDLNFKDWDGNTALMWASYDGHTEVVDLLLSKCSEATINNKNKYGDTALMWASCGNTEIVKALLAKCSEATINNKNKYGDTALTLASCYGYIKIVKALLTKCSESTINIQNNYKNTALIYASRYDHAEIVEELIYISDIHIKNNQKETAFDIVYKKEITDLFDLNTGCDTSLRYGKSISNVILASLHSLKSSRWLNLF